jgi:hypothetical protein
MTTASHGWCENTRLQSTVESQVDRGSVSAVEFPLSAGETRLPLEPGMP